MLFIKSLTDMVQNLDSLHYKVYLTVLPEPTTLGLFILIFLFPGNASTSLNYGVYIRVDLYPALPYENPGITIHHNSQQC